MKLRTHDLEKILETLETIKGSNIDVDSFKVHNFRLIVKRTDDQRDGADYYIESIEEI